MSVPSPLYSTRNNTPFYLFPGAKKSFLEIIPQNKIAGAHSLSAISLSLLGVLLTYNLRVVECLQLKSSDLIGADRAVVLGAKGSRSTIIYLPGVDEGILPHVPLGSSLPLFPIPYKKFWKECTRAGVRLSKGTSSNLAVTHISRYLVAHRVATKYNLRVASDCLRHNDKKSIQYYLK